MGRRKGCHYVGAFCPGVCPSDTVLFLYKRSPFRVWDVQYIHTSSIANLMEFPDPDFKLDNFHCGTPLGELNLCLIQVLAF